MGGYRWHPAEANKISACNKSICQNSDCCGWGEMASGRMEIRCPARRARWLSESLVFTVIDMTFVTGDPHSTYHPSISVDRCGGRKMCGGKVILLYFSSFVWHCSPPASHLPASPCFILRELFGCIGAVAGRETVAEPSCYANESPLTSMAVILPLSL